MAPLKKLHEHNCCYQSHTVLLRFVFTPWSRWTNTPKCQLHRKPFISNGTKRYRFHY